MSLLQLPVSFAPLPHLYLSSAFLLSILSAPGPLPLPCEELYFSASSQTIACHNLHTSPHWPSIKVGTKPG